MNVLLVGDGPLADEIALLVEGAGHTLRKVLVRTDDGADFTRLFRVLDSLRSEAFDLGIEVILGSKAAKADVVEALTSFFGPAGSIPLLTATLNASATEVAAWSKQRAVPVCGFALLPPLVDTIVIEFMPALQTSEEAKEKARAFWQSVGKEPVEVADSVGGVVPRIVCNLINEAAYALMEGVATPEDIDLAMQLGTNWPRGPLAWADLIGPNQVVAILEALGDEFGNDQYRPAPLLRQYARAGRRFYPDKP